MSAAISRDGIAIATNSMELFPLQSQPLILKIPPDNSDANANYKLHIEGRLLSPTNRGISFEHDADLQFERRFLSITITTNHAVYDAGQTVRIRAVFLTTSLKPYDGIADLFFIDPDGYVIRKWNSQHLNVGVLIKEFDLPSWPKVGFWTIRVTADGQTEELRIKVEKHLLPRIETVISMPTYALDTEEFIEAVVEGTFIVERVVVGDIDVKWFAKKIDYQTPYYNDTTYHVEVSLCGLFYSKHYLILLTVEQLQTKDSQCVPQQFVPDDQR